MSVNTKKKILIVENEKDFALDTQNRLISMGYHVPAIAYSGEDAVRKAKEYQPDLVLINPHFKRETGGVEVIRRIRNAIEVPVGYIISDINDTHLEDIMRSEPCGILFRPFEDMELKTTIEIALYTSAIKKRVLESEKRFSRLSNLTFEGILLHKGGTVIDINDSLANLIGYTREELIGSNIIKLAVLEEYHATITDNMTKKSTVPYEVLGRKKDGTIFPVELESRNVEFRNEALRVTAVRDITQRRQMEEKLVEDDRRLRAILEASPVGVCLVVDRKLDWANSAMYEMAGYERGSLTGESARIFYPDQEEYERVGRKLYTEKDTSEISYAEATCVNKDGTPVDCILRACHLDPADPSRGQIVTVTDISDLKRSNEELRKSEERHRTLVEATSEGFWFIDPEKITVDFNQSLCDMLGYTRDEMIGKTPFDFVDDENRMIFTEQISHIRETRHRNYEIVLTKKDGTKVPVVITATSLTNTDGNPTGSFAFVTDITNLKRAEEAVAKSEEKFRKAFQTIPDSVSIRRLEDCKCIDINSGFTNTWGYTKEDIIGKGLTECTIWNDIRDRERLVAGLERDGEVHNLEVLLKTKGGDIRDGLMSASLIELEGVPHILSVTHDITDRKNSQRALEESETKYRLLADNVNDVIFTLDMDMKFTYISPSMKTLTGYEPEEALKQDPLEMITSASRELAMMTLADVVDLERSRPGHIDISRTLDLETIRKDRTTVWTDVRFSLIRDANKQPVNILGVSRDITARKQAEEELQHTLSSLRNAVGTTIQVMMSALEVRDPYTAGHQARVANLSRAIATEMDLSEGQIEGIHMAASIHDIGKLSLPSEILSKPTKLTENELALAREHALQGYEILKNIESPWPLAEIVYQHHERMDGSGYPRGLKGSDILLEARIIAVADVVEAMSSHRPYRPARGLDAALDEIKRHKGIVYDTTVADVCLRLFHEKGFQF